MDESKFCSGCGKTLEPGMQFCPQCGCVVSGSAADEEFKEREKEISAVMLSVRRNWLVFFLAIYAIPVIIASVFTLIDSTAIANAIWDSTEFQNWIASHGFNYDVDDIKNYITVAGALALVSGLCAVVSLVCVFKKKKWVIAVGACVLAAILCFWSVFGIIIGFIVAWLIAGSKDLFEN